MFPKGKMRLKEFLALLCVTMTCGAQRRKQEESRWDSKGQEFDLDRASPSDFIIASTFAFRLYSDALLFLMSVSSGVQQRQDVFKSYPGAGQLEVCHRNAGERPAGQRPRLRSSWIQQVGALHLWLWPWTRKKQSKKTENMSSNCFVRSCLSEIGTYVTCRDGCCSPHAASSALRMT